MLSSTDPASGGALGVWRRRLFWTRSLHRAWLLRITGVSLALVSPFWILKGRVAYRLLPFDIGF